MYPYRDLSTYVITSGQFLPFNRPNFSSVIITKCQKITRRRVRRNVAETSKVQTPHRIKSKSKYFKVIIWNSLLQKNELMLWAWQKKQCALLHESSFSSTHKELSRYRHKHLCLRVSTIMLNIVYVQRLK